MKNGDIVYVLGYVGDIYRAIFRSYIPNSRTAFPYVVDILYKMDESGEPLLPPSGVTVPKRREVDKVYVTFTEAYISQGRQTQLRSINSYCEKIKTVQDLLAFPLKYDFSGSPHAQAAYKKRAQALFGKEIDI